MWWVNQRMHTSWLVAVVSASFVCGVFIVLPVKIVAPWLGFVSLLFLFIVFFFRRRWVLGMAVIGGLLLGYGYGSAVYGNRSLYALYIGKQVRYEGRLKEDVSKSPGGYSLQLDAGKVNGESLPGAILTTIRSNDAKRGDLLVIEGELQPPFGSFAATIKNPTVLSITRPLPGDVGRVVRDWFVDKVRQGIPEPQASLGIGFLTGQKSALPEDLSESLKIAGLTHIVVASGYNLTILVRMARKLFLKLSKFLSAVSSAVIIVAFMAITGLSPSMTRAGLVSGMSLMAWYYGHAFHPLILLPFAAAITVAIQPGYVWGDLGWQLSFSAFAGVMVLAPLLQQYFFGDKQPGTIRQILGETIAAHAVTIPVIALSFGTISNVAIIANILVVPLVPLAMLLTFIIGCWSIAGLPFLDIVSIPVSWLLGYMTSVATFVSELSWAQAKIDLPGWAWVTYVFMLVVICGWLWKATRHNFRDSEPFT